MSCQPAQVIAGDQVWIDLLQLIIAFIGTILVKRYCYDIRSSLHDFSDSVCRNADTIVGNCDTLLFLGGKEKTTLKEMEELLGKETIDTFNTGESRGRETSHSLNYQKLGKSLMSVDEIAVMDGGKCILQVRGVRPFLSDKYDITSHPNYKYLSDSDPKNAFHIEKYLSRQLRLRLEEESQVWEIDVSDNPDEEEALLEELTDETQLTAAGYGGLL